MQRSLIVYSVSRGSPDKIKYSKIRSPDDFRLCVVLSSWRPNALHKCLVKLSAITSGSSTSNPYSHVLVSWSLDNVTFGYSRREIMRARVRRSKTGPPGYGSTPKQRSRGGSPTTTLTQRWIGTPF
ncbi:hypothetical protein C0J52_27671 [Blattella germanica]|nr:hypothetical protein C0J52_27671 [Blattella germanica]